MNACHSHRLTHSSLRLLTAALLLCSLAIPLPTSAEEEADKAIRVREGQTAALQVTLEPVKPTFRVGEPLRFNLRANQRVYLYLYSVDPKTGKTILLLPNNRQKTNQYEANRTYKVPNREVEFFSDAPGTEQLIMVTSTRHLDIDTSKYSKAGDFLSADTRQVESQFEEKGIRIRGPESSRQGGVITKELTLRVVGQGGDRKMPGADSEDNGRASVFVSTAKERYTLGERVRITFGADRKGWVHLYTADPDGAYSRLTQQPVDGQALQQVSARAESPTGDYKVVGVYTKTEQFDENLLDRIGDNKEVTKGLRLESGDPASYAVRHFRIED